jgi:hypothetical protein
MKWILIDLNGARGSLRGNLAKLRIGSLGMRLEDTCEAADARFEEGWFEND